MMVCWARAMGSSAAFSRLSFISIASISCKRVLTLLQRRWTVVFEIAIETGRQVGCYIQVVECW